MILKTIKAYNEVLSANGTAVTTDSAIIDITPGMSIAGNQVKATVSPANQNFLASAVNTANDTITIPNHNFLLGLAIKLSTTGTLPSPLLTATNYFVIVVDSSTIKLASSQANAVAGTAIDLTTQGSGTDTCVVQGLNGTWSLLTSQDQINWFAIDGPTSISATNKFFTFNNLTGLYLKCTLKITTGAVSANIDWVLKGIA